MTQILSDLRARKCRCPPGSDGEIHAAQSELPKAPLFRAAAGQQAKAWRVDASGEEDRPGTDLRRRGELYASLPFPRRRAAGRRAIPGPARPALNRGRAAHGILGAVIRKGHPAPHNFYLIDDIQALAFAAGGVSHEARLHFVPSRDRGQINGLRLLAANTNFDIEFYDESVRTPINSQNAAYIRSKIREKISRTSVTLCMVGPLTHTSQWVSWELDESIDKGNSIICMGLPNGPDRLTLPEPAQRLKLEWWLWDHDRLAQLIKAAP